MATRNYLSVCVLATFASLSASVVLGQDSNVNGAVLIFIDDLHIQFRNTPRLRTGMLQAIERLATAGRAIGVVSDGSSSIALRPTQERATLVQLANRIAGGGLRPEETVDPTPSIIADMKRREALADTTWQSVLTTAGVGGILYVTERQVQPTTGSVRVVVTRPEGMDAAAAELLPGN